MEFERLTKRIGDYVYFTKGAYSETLPAEMTTSDVRQVLSRLASYEDACYNDNGREVMSRGYLRVIKTEVIGDRENEKPLSLLQLRDMDGDPVFDLNANAWRVVDDIDDVDELCSIIRFTDGFEFNTETESYSLYACEPLKPTEEA